MAKEIIVTHENIDAVCNALIKEAKDCRYNFLCFGMMDISREENTLTEIDNILVSLGKVFDISQKFPKDWNVSDLKGGLDEDRVLISFEHCRSLSEI